MSFSDWKKIRQLSLNEDNSPQDNLKISTSLNASVLASISEETSKTLTQQVYTNIERKSFEYLLYYIIV